MRIIKNYSDFVNENILHMDEKLKIKIRKGKKRHWGFTVGKAGSEVIDPMDWMQDVITPESEWDSYLAANEAPMVKKMSEASKTYWAELKADPVNKGYAVAALERFIETNPKMKWEYVFCNTEEGVKTEFQKIPRISSTAEAPSDFNGVNMPIEFPMEGPSSTFFDDNKWAPTAVFEAKLTQEVLNPLKEIAATMVVNPNANEPKFFLTSIEIYTSCSRFRNSGEAAGLTFAQLSANRNTAAKDFIIKKLAELGVLVDSDTVITQSTEGKNGDGSSGPNPPAPLAMTKSGKEADVIKTEDNRDDFGTPIADKTKYDQYKYCIAGLEIVANTNWKPADSTPGEPTDEPTYDIITIPIPTKNYGISFYSKSTFIGISFRLPQIKISGRLWRKHSGKYKKGKNWGSIKCPKFS